MKITVVGCGAMGSIYAALLASDGHDVIAVDTNQAHIDAINNDGLRVSGASGDRTVSIPAHTAAPDEPADLLILAVKGAHAASAAEVSKPLVDKNTIILTIQNGLGSADKVAGVLGADRLIVGVAQGFGASLPSPGHAHHNDMKAIRMGSYASLGRDQTHEISEVYRHAGFDADCVNDIAAMQWDKLICNVAYSAPSALTGMTVGEVMNDPIMGEVSRNAAIEAWDIACALKINIDIPDPVAHVRNFAGRMPEAKPSVLLDIEAGRPSEIGLINGAVPVQAAKVDMTAPVNDTLTRLVLSMERKNNKGS